MFIEKELGGVPRVATPTREDAEGEEAAVASIVEAK
jgi:hypothetical protein